MKKKLLNSKEHFLQYRALLRNTVAEGEIKLLWKHQKCSTDGILSFKSNSEPHLGLKGFRRNETKSGFVFIYRSLECYVAALSYLGVKIEFQLEKCG